MVKSAFYEILSDRDHEVRTEIEIPDEWILDVVDADTAMIYEVETDLTHPKKKSKVKRCLQAQCMGRVINDIIFFNPTELPADMEELREELQKQLIF